MVGDEGDGKLRPSDGWSHRIVGSPAGSIAVLEGRTHDVLEPHGVPPPPVSFPPASFPQPTFWLLCYLGCFTIPAAYGRCRAAMDEGTEAALRFVARLLVTGSRASLALAGGVGVVLLAALPLNLVLRATLAAVAAFGVLLWQSEALQQAKAGMYGGGAGGAGGVGGAGRAYLVQEEAKGQGGGGGGSGGGAGLRVPLSHMHRE